MNKLILKNNQRKMAGLPLWRKKDKRKRHFTRNEFEEVIGSFIEYCHSELS